MKVSKLNLPRYEPSESHRSAVNFAEVDLALTPRVADATEGHLVHSELHEAIVEDDGAALSLSEDCGMWSAS